MSLQTSLPWKEFLERPVPSECRDHTVRFFENDYCLAESLACYISAGLMQGEAVVVITTPANELSCLKELIKMDCRVGDAIRTEQLSFFNANETLLKLMVGEFPDWNEFQSVIGSLIENRINRFSKLRVYGDMVDILRNEGNIEGMIRLEEHWNKLSESYSFSLLCGYKANSFGTMGHECSFEKACKTHSHIFTPCHSIQTKEMDEESRNRAIAIMLQELHALNEEIQECKRLEKSLRDIQNGLNENFKEHDNQINIQSRKRNSIGRGAI
jgi:hypothetical protein